MKKYKEFINESIKYIFDDNDRKEIENILKELNIFDKVHFQYFNNVLTFFPKDLDYYFLIIMQEEKPTYYNAKGISHIGQKKYSLYKKDIDKVGYGTKSELVNEYDTIIDIIKYIYNDIITSDFDIFESVHLEKKLAEYFIPPVNKEEVKNNLSKISEYLDKLFNEYKIHNFDIRYSIEGSNYGHILVIFLFLNSKMTYRFTFEKEGIWYSKNYKDGKKFDSFENAVQFAIDDIITSDFDIFEGNLFNKNKPIPVVLNPDALTEKEIDYFIDDIIGEFQKFGLIVNMPFPAKYNEKANFIKFWFRIYASNFRKLVGILDWNHHGKGWKHNTIKEIISEPIDAIENNYGVEIELADLVDNSTNRLTHSVNFSMDYDFLFKVSNIHKHMLVINRDFDIFEGNLFNKKYVPKPDNSKDFLKQFTEFNLKREVNNKLKELNLNQFEAVEVKFPVPKVQQDNRMVNIISKNKEDFFIRISKLDDDEFFIKRDKNKHIADDKNRFEIGYLNNGVYVREKFETFDQTMEYVANILMTKDFDIFESIKKIKKKIKIPEFLSKRSIEFIEKKFEEIIDKISDECSLFQPWYGYGNQGNDIICNISSRSKDFYYDFDINKAKTQIEEQLFCKVELIPIKSEEDRYRNNKYIYRFVDFGWIIILKNLNNALITSQLDFDLFEGEHYDAGKPYKEKYSPYIDELLKEYDLQNKVRYVINSYEIHFGKKDQSYNYVLFYSGGNIELYKNAEKIKFYGNVEDAIRYIITDFITDDFDIFESKEESGDKYWGSKDQPYWHKGANPTADMIVKRKEDDKILLIKRKKTARSEPGKWAIPGGFINIKADVGDPDTEGWKETGEEAAARECYEETGLNIKKYAKKFKKIGVYEGGGRDPRDNKEAWTKSHVYYFELPKGEKSDVRGKDDAEGAGWFSKEEISKMEIAFDHRKILNKI